MTITWVMLRRRRARGYMIWADGSGPVRDLPAFPDRQGLAERLLDVRALVDRPVISAVPAASVLPVPGLRAGSRSAAATRLRLIDRTSVWSHFGDARMLAA